MDKLNKMSKLDLAIKEETKKLETSIKNDVKKDLLKIKNSAKKIYEEDAKEVSEIEMDNIIANMDFGELKEMVKNSLKKHSDN